MSVRLNIYVRLTGLLAGLALILLLFPGGHHCVAGLDSYFVIGAPILFASWVLAFRLLKSFRILSRLAATVAFAILTVIVWLIILSSREFYLLCW